MSKVLRERTLRGAVTELVDFETDLEGALNREREADRGSSDVMGALARLLPVVRAHRDRLANYVNTLGSVKRSGKPKPGFVFSPPSTVSGALRQISDALNHGTVSYAILYELALRLYEPPLREIAPKHLKAYADEARNVNNLVPAVVAWELDRNELHCMCICPLCGLGACGCIAMGTQTLVAALRAPESPSSGFVIQPPRPESGLAKAGLQGGERLLSIDGQEVRAIPEMQAALRKHAVGEEVQLVVQRGSEPPREVTVRHVSDYPKT